MKQLKINLNSQVDIKLNDKGLAIIKDLEFPEVFKIRPNGRVSMQLYEAIALFGPYMHPGATPVFKNNELTVKK